MFCAGADLKERRTMSPEQAITFVRWVSECVHPSTPAER
jgi:hypothetical protein